HAGEDSEKMFLTVGMEMHYLHDEVEEYANQ
ncbi:MAG: cell division protein DedD, partial [Candidatus Moranbacteria bacterium CG_4_9_14_3_um_filter_36_9]